MRNSYFPQAKDKLTRFAVLNMTLIWWSFDRGTLELCVRLEEALKRRGGTRSPPHPQNKTPDFQRQNAFTVLWITTRLLLYLQRAGENSPLRRSCVAASGGGGRCRFESGRRALRAAVKLLLLPLLEGGGSGSGVNGRTRYITSCMTGAKCHRPWGSVLERVKTK